MSTTQIEYLSTVAISEWPEVANVDEANRQNVQQKTTQKLIGRIGRFPGQVQTIQRADGGSHLLLGNAQVTGRGFQAAMSH
jgi:hypothetical protein